LSFDNLFCLKIEAEDVINLVSTGKDDTGPGYDRMTIKLLKYVIDFIKNPLVYIYNLSTQQGIFPDFHKLAVIRPISLLSNFAKIFEKIIKKRLS